MKMKQIVDQVLLVAIVLAGTSACGINETKTQPQSVSAADTVAGVSYAQVKSAVFSVSCQSCHMNGHSAGGVSLDTYSSTNANLGLIHSTVFDGSPAPMPPRGALTADQKTLLQEWLDEGAPEAAPTVAPVVTPPPFAPAPAPSATPVPTSTPVPGPLLPTYQSIRDQVFSGPSQCLSCHAAGKSAAKLPLDDYNAMMAVSGFVIPGNPGGSILISPLVKGTMPPKRFPQVTADQLTVIKLWITNGASP